MFLRCDQVKFFSFGNFAHLRQDSHRQGKGFYPGRLIRCRETDPSDTLISLGLARFVQSGGYGILLTVTDFTYVYPGAMF